MASGAEVVSLKEDRARKTYRVLVRFAGSVEGGKLKLAAASLASRPIGQRTPARVSHRRAGPTPGRLVTAGEGARMEKETAGAGGTAGGGGGGQEGSDGGGGRATPRSAEGRGSAR